ncbi:MAG TPA: hypothetical protein PLV45_11230, partial [bacterium]|nr:hypothetical protein [bacterium]
DTPPQMELYFPRPWSEPETYRLDLDPGERRKIQPPEPVSEKLRDLWRSVFVSIPGTSWDTDVLDPATEKALKELGYIQ